MIAPLPRAETTVAEDVAEIRAACGCLMALLDAPRPQEAAWYMAVGAQLERLSRIRRGEARL